MKRICGSVRSSLSVLARLVTVGLEAIETTFPHHYDAETAVRRSRNCERHAVGETGWMTCPTQVNCFRHRNNQRAKDADRLRPKRQRSRRLRPTTEAHGHSRLPVYVTGANSSVSVQSNLVNPTFRPGTGAGASARHADGVAGRGNWKKRTPLGNRADRSCNITPPRKRADFQSVAHDEKAGRTFTGGNCK